MSVLPLYDGVAAGIARSNPSLPTLLVSGLLIVGGLGSWTLAASYKDSPRDEKLAVILWITALGVPGIFYSGLVASMPGYPGWVPPLVMILISLYLITDRVLIVRITTLLAAQSIAYSSITSHPYSALVYGFLVVLLSSRTRGVVPIIGGSAGSLFASLLSTPVLPDPRSLASLGIMVLVGWGSTYAAMMAGMPGSPERLRRAAALILLAESAKELLVLAV